MRNSSTAGLNCNVAARARFACRWFEGLNTQSRERKSRHPDVCASARAIDNRSRANHLSAVVFYRFDRIARRSACGNHVFNHQDSLTSTHSKSATQGHCFLVPLSPDEAHAQLPCNFISNDQTADCRRSNCRYSIPAKFVSNSLAKPRSHSGRLQRNGALQVDGAVQTTRENKMAFE